MPECGDQYIEWFWELRLFVNGQDAPLTPSVIGEWIGVSGALLSREDHGILYAMDREYRSQMPKTVEYHQKRRDITKGV